MNIIVLTNDETILTFLNPELVDITETFQDGLRSIDVEYNIEELSDAQSWFKQGHKIFIVGDRNLTDCLYVLNTEVKQDLFDENRFKFTAEEVLVELNYAPFFHQGKLSDPAFTTSKKDNETAFKVDWNSLNYLFGKYFNIGIVQDCLSEYSSKVTFNGSMQLMSLLRYIEEETGNVFVTRYEKDINTNVVHRYLDFLNPVSMNKNWNCYFEYDFIPAIGACIIDDSGQPVDDDTDPVDDDLTPPVHVDVTNIDLTNIRFRLTHNGVVIVAENGTQLQWTATDIGLTSSHTNIAIQIKYSGTQVGIRFHDKTYNIPSDPNAVGGLNSSYLATISDDPTLIDDKVLLPNNTHFEFYDNSTGKVLYSRTLNPILSTARTEVLDLGYNVDNIEFSMDESDTFIAMSPTLSLKDNNNLTSNDMLKIVKNWLALEVNKGDMIPMFCERIGVTSNDENSYKCVQRTGTARAPNKSAEQILGTYVLSSRYYDRPVKPSDNTDNDNKTYEYWVGSAYWKAPFKKAKNSFHLELDSSDQIDYSYISPRTDYRTGRSVGDSPKMGEVTTSEENVYNIYNAVAMKLKEKQYPDFNITVDVANYKDGLLNEYRVHDKVYVKLPGTDGLVTAKVIKTVKALHDISENKVVLDNYSATVKESTKDTYIESSNISFKYPKSKKLTVTLKNTDDDNDLLSNKLVTFALYESGGTTLKKAYTKKTNSKGQASLTCKYDPGDYEIKVQFGGDVEYSECSATILVNVTGVKKTKTTTTTSTTAKKYTNVKRYWSKYGESPDKKLVKAIGRASAPGELGKYGYTFYEAEYKNVCPKCGKKGTLFWDIFWAGDEHTDYGYIRKTRNWEGSSAEGTITCSNPKCDGDWSIFGKEHGYSNTKLTVHKKVKKSSKKRAYELRNGKMYYDTIKKEVKTKKVVNKQKRNYAPGGKLTALVKKTAEGIVGDSVGRSALLKICEWMDKKIGYTRYCGFCRSPDEVLKRKHCNCCDGTRLLLALCDAAGLTDYYHMYYVHVPGHVYAQLKSKSTGKRVYIDTASSRPCYGYVCQGYQHGNPSSTYPSQPFQGACTSC